MFVCVHACGTHVNIHREKEEGERDRHPHIENNQRKNMLLTWRGNVARIQRTKAGKKGRSVLILLLLKTY